MSQFNNSRLRKALPAVSTYIVALATALPALLIPLSIHNLPAKASKPQQGSYKHVLLLSVDGLRQADLNDPHLRLYLPNIFNLARLGITYTNASTSKPSDSFPGTLAYLTGASPQTTGVYYDDAYSRLLTAPGGTPTSPRGTEVQYAENIDRNSNSLSGGGNYGVGSIDPTKLPQQCTSSSCQPVYPHDYLKVNTIFEVAKAAGLHTAFTEKHPAYDIANGPSGKGVDDLFTPEINALVSIQNGKLVDDPNGKSVTSSTTATELYDDIKVSSILNEIAGWNSVGTTQADVPAIFGMNFQAVSVAEKDRAAGGIDANGTPSAELIDALKHTDQSIGQILTSLQQHNLLNSTLVILTAKHGQDPRLGAATLIKDDIFINALKQDKIEVVQATQDDVALLWLKDPNQTQKASQLIKALKNSRPDAGIDKVLTDKELEQSSHRNSQDGQTPNLIVTLKTGFVLVGNPSTSNKRAEHGGFVPDDTHVPLIVASGNFPAQRRGKAENEQVTTTQIAVTILKALGLNPNDLQGAKAEKTKALPGL